MYDSLGKGCDLIINESIANVTYFYLQIGKNRGAFCLLHMFYSLLWCHVDRFCPTKHKNNINSCTLQMIVSAARLVFPLLVVIGQGACLAWAPVKLLDERG